MMRAIARRLRHAARREIGGRRADNHPQIRKLAHDQLRIVQAAAANDEMDVFLDHVDGAVDQQKIDRQRRIAAQEFREQGRDHKPAYQT
ncbi:alkylation response protein AidB-like acyl-CoA dehydrogenase [Bradyrhizobium sp. AZCC 1610]